MLKTVARLAVGILGPVEIRGETGVLRKGPLIVAANHISLLDPIVLYACWPTTLTFIAAGYLYRLPLVRLFLRLSKALPAGSVSGTRKAVRVLAGGGSLGVFPEGRIGPDGRLLPLKSGWSRLAVKTGSTVIPVGIEGTDRILPLGRLLPRRGRMVLKIGDPIVADSPGSLCARVEEELRRMTGR